MIVLFTDFGLGGPYVGQMKAVLAQAAPAVPVVDLLADAPACDPRAAAYLLPAYSAGFPAGSVFLCVVDPGVGSDRQALAVKAAHHWYVGPDNGLLALAVRRVEDPRIWRITWQPQTLSASFHGRDLFAPLAARVACGGDPIGEVLMPDRMIGHDWPDDLSEIVYIDAFGNAITGLRANQLAADTRLRLGGQSLPRARTFSAVAQGEAFWYENANGLAEIAVNRGRADRLLGATIGSPVQIDCENRGEVTD